MPNYLDPFSGDQISISPTGYIDTIISVDTQLSWPINGDDGPTTANILEVTATTTGLTLTLPPANQVSPGQSLIVKNLGSNTFTVASFGGATVASPLPGTSWYLYVTDNSTAAGVWSTLQFGASTSIANAAALAGAGLDADGPVLETAYMVTNLFSSAVLTDANRAQFLVWTSGAGSITLPATSVIDNGWFVIVRNSGSGIVTLTPSGANTIDGNPNLQVQLNTSVVLVSSGSNWSTFGFQTPSTFVYTQLDRTITGGTVTLTSVEAANVIQEYFGVLTSNAIIILPSTVQMYSFSNQTTGPYTLTFKTAAVGGSVVTLAQNNTVIAISDGTNVYNASTATVGAISSLTLSPGSSAAPSLNFTGNTQTGVYVPNSHTFGITVEGNAIAIFGDAAATIPGLSVPLGISGGTF